MAQASQWKSLMVMLQSMARVCAAHMSRAVDATREQLGAEATANIQKPNPSHTVRTQALNKFGAIVPCILRKNAIKNDDDLTKPTGYLSSWDILPIEADNWHTTSVLPADY